MVGSTFFIVTDQLFGILGGTANLVLNKLTKTLCVGSMLKLKVNSLTMLLLSDIATFLLSVVFKNKLLQE
jgi:hypothetical protein